MYNNIDKFLVVWLVIIMDVENFFYIYLNLISKFWIVFYGSKIYKLMLEKFKIY